MTLLVMAKAALASLPTAHYMALGLPFTFSQVQFVQAFLLKLAPFCELSADLGSINNSAAFLLLLSDSCSVLHTSSSPPSFLLPQAFWWELSSLSFFTVRLQLVPGHSFLPVNDAADELARRGALLLPPAVPCSLSPLTSRIHSCLFSVRRRTVSSKLFETHVPQCLLKN